MLTAASGSYLCGWLLYTDLRRAFQLQVTHKVASETAAGASHPTPRVGEGKHSDMKVFQNHRSVLEAKKISRKLERETLQREGEKAFLWCEHACEENASSHGMKPGDKRGYLWNPSEGFHSEGECNFLLVPGEEDLVHR